MNSPSGAAPFLSADRRRLLAALLGDAGLDGAAGAEIPRRSGDEPAPLSFAQQRLWLIDRLEPGSDAYNVALALRLRGELDPALLRRVLGELVRRHESLRTVFPRVDGEPVQRVRPAGPAVLPGVDLGALPHGTREAELARLAREEARRPFNLERGPLLRTLLVRLAPAERALLLTLHHAVSDAWSMGILVREASALYAAFAGGGTSELPELPVQYADFAAWQRERLSDGRLDAQLAWWRARLAGAPPVLELPTDRPRPPVPSARGGEVRFLLPGATARALGEWARHQGATSFMALLAGWKALLARYAAQDDVLVGTPVAGRDRAETAGVIGLFADTLVLRTDLGGDPTAAELLARVREGVLGAFAHQDLPFERLVEALRPDRSLRHTPLFQVLFAHHVAEEGGLRLGEAEVEPIRTGEAAAKFDLTVELADTGGEVGGVVTYRKELWDRPTVARMAERFLAVLAAFAARPDARLSSLPLLSDGERRRLLEEWNPPPPEASAPPLLQRVAEQAERRGGTPAVAFGGEVLTYAALDRRAGALALRLRGMGVGPEVRVGICMERSTEQVVGVLAVLRAGGACVPLDPRYPAERLAFMLADSGARVLLTQEGVRGRLPEFAGEVVCLDGGAPSAAVDALPTAPLSECLAYVIYTSGSTGTPKGVGMPHRPLERLVDWQLRSWNGPAAARTLQFASLSFDVSFQEILTTWAAGGTLVLLAEEDRGDLARLARLLEAERIERLFLPFAALQHLAETAGELGIAPASLREVITAGEQLRVTEPIRRWLSRIPGCVLVNQYGPSETHVATALPLAGPAEGWPELPGIGRPVDGARCHVLDPHLRLAPPGLPGELFLGGECVARGYPGRPELTAARFLPDPFSPEPGARMYRTGDRARWTAAGELEFLGRVDQQVKVRGFRVEPGEVEAALERHPAVREAVVVAREAASGAPGDRRLVAYLVPVDGRGAPAAGELREILGRSLPEHMVPSAFVEMEALPLTPSGKIHRAALPELDAGADTAPYLAPRDAVEEIVAGIWAEVLGVERVGVHDDFFALGGHSLLATRAASRLGRALGVEVPLRAFFEAPTPGGLARRVEDLLRGGAGERVPPIAPAPRGAEGLPLSPAQQRLWFVHRLDPESPAFNLSFSLRIRGALDPRALERAFSELVRRHEPLRTVFHAAEGGALQSVLPPAPRPLPVVDLGGVRGAAGAARRLAREAASRPFDLERGPPLRTVLLRAGPDEWLLHLALHHVAGDAWSMGVLVREVSDLYGAYAAGLPSPLPEPELQYADFALWQRAWLTGETLERQLAYWTERLAGAPPLLELPAARPRPGVPARRSGSRSRVLAAAASAALRAVARREGATLFMALLAGWKALLARYSGQTDVVVGTPVAGRTRRETEALVGCFLNTLALRTDLSGDPTFRELLGRARETALGAYAHQDLPFERLLEALPVERSLDRTPVFQAMFNLVNTPGAAPSLPGLAVEALSPGGGAESRTDVGLYAVERGGEVHFDLVYDAERFEDERMEEMLRHLCLLLEAAAADPGLRLSALPPCAPRPSGSRGTERVQPAGPFVEFPRGDLEQSVAQRFARQVRLHGERVAVSGGGVRLTYGELDAAAGRTAGALLAERGAGEERVGVLLGHDATMVAGVLGALRAGKTYVPLDPRYPEERLALVLGDARPGAILTDAANLPLAARLSGGALPLLRADVPDGAPAAVEAPPDRPAYILYTSGSTGRPKGVVQSHRNVLHHVRAYTNNLRIGAADRLSLFSSFAFDAAVMDVFGALLNGAALCPFDLRGEGSDGLSRWMEREGITVFHSTPTVFRHLLHEHAPGAGFPGVRLVVLGGEEAGRGEVELFLRHFGPGCVLVNGLGPTESTLALQAFLDRDTALRGGPVPVGFPVDDTEVLLLNAAGEQPAVYGTGEILVRSAYVALGYWDRPEATRAAFLPDPRGGDRRTYRTGDLGRWLPDGSIQFLGRADHQVKVRGHRVEPGEVEAALLAHPGVRRAAVGTRPDPRGERRLVAWVVPGGAAPEPAALREHLRARLPEFMVPAAVVLLEELPRTPSGKTDRAALPDPEWGGGADREHRAPRTPAEEGVARAWAELLGVERVGVDDDFFELGGHSLLAMRVASRLRAAFGVELPLRDLFEATTVAALAARVDAARTAGASVPLPPLRPVPRDGALPLSFAQQRLWFVQQLDPADTSYNLGGGLRLSGALDGAALRAALEGLVRRHETLRTRIVTAPVGEAVQVVDPPRPVPLPLDDLAALPAPERETGVRRRVAAEMRRPFDLERGPVFRARLLRLGAREHVLVFAMHHVVSDAWSAGVLARELSALYAAAAAGTAPELPELPVQYADYAAWQREWMSGPVLEVQLAWWTRRLHGAPPALPLPADRPRAAATAFASAAEHRVLPPETARALAGLARTEGATPFMALLAGWQALLARYAGEEDVVVGTPVAGRTRPELEGLIGFFVNTLALRTELSGGPGFCELLGRVREAALGAFEHQELPFERLVDALETGRDPGRHPVFQVMFTLQNAPRAALRFAGVALDPMPAAAAATPFELSLTLREEPGGTAAELQYAADLFEPATARRMLAHYGALLEAALAEPDRPVAELPLLDAAERGQLLERWSGAPAPVAGGATVVEMIRARAARDPGAPAVVLGERSLDFAELVGRADAVARRLRRLGAGPETRVAVLLDRSLELPVALLGALCAGAAYVPVDPELPPERIAWLLEDTGAAAVLTRAELRGRVPAAGAAVLCVEEDGAGEEEGVPLPAADPASLAYVIHTSGSTGTPKGAMVEHGALAAFALAMGARLGLGPGDRMLQFAALGFDVVVEELFPAWTHGAAVVLHEADLLDAPEELLRVLERRGVTGLELPTAYWHEWVRALAMGGGRLPPRVRFVIIGGERVSPERLVEWARLGVPLVHVYGLTETTVTTTTLDLPAGDDGSGWGNLPIGRPVPGARVYLLDAHLEPVPVGVPGELCVGGAGVGRGYLGRPGLTAGRWVPDPFAATPGARMYRTGDRARWLGDGTVEFLGRTDHQVKVRGFRVEPGEVEAALLALPQVSEAVVAARPAPGGGARLVGWVVPAEGWAGEPAGLVRGAGEERVPWRELRDAMARSIPAHMVPDALVALGALPLTRHGKLDRGALPDPDPSPADGAYRAPAPGAEGVLAGVWAAVLGLERVGADDNFFALGGDSILSIQVVARARAAGVRVTPRQLFEHPTVAGLARAAREAAPAAAGEEGSAVGEAPLTPVQRWFFAQPVPDRSHWNVAALLEPREPLEPAVLEEAVAALLEHHDALRSRFVPGADGWRQHVPPAGARVPTSRLDLGALREAEQREALERAAAALQAGLDLERGPVLRAALFERGPGRTQRVLLVVHHLVMDGVAWRVLMEDLEAACDALSRGLRPELPPRTTPWRVWAERLASHADAPGVRAQADFWTSAVRDLPPPLPVDFRRGPALEGTSASVSVSLDPGETRALLQEVPPVYRTRVDETLLAALARVFAEWTGDARLWVELEGHGREELFPDLDPSRTVGWFTTQYPVLLDLRGAPGEGDALRAVKEQLRAVPDRGIGYGLLRWLSPDPELRAALARARPPEVAFNYLGQFRDAAAGGGRFARAAESAGRETGPRTPRTHALAVGALVADDRLRAWISYSPDLHDRATVETLAGRFAAELRGIVEHCRAPGAGGYTPSDFTAVRLDQRSLDKILLQVKG